MGKKRYWLIFIVLTALLSLTIFSLPRLLKPEPLLKNIPFSQAIYDKHKQLLRLTLASDEKYRLYTPLKDISLLVVQGTLLQEDRYFYWHAGVNPVALLRAVWQTYIKRDRQMGASTITMQLARLYYHIDSKTISGKFQQLLRATQLELLYSKQDILEAYLNLAPYGGNIEGVGAASLVYFGKPANQLTLPEALLLSVVPQNPIKRSGLSKKNLAELQTARLRLFSAWLREHPSDKSQAKYLRLPLQFTHTALPFLAAHFVDNVLQSKATAPTVVTTLDLRLQRVLENSVRQYLTHYQTLGVTNVAVLLVDRRTMEVKALLGSGNFFSEDIRGQINGTLAKRSPGSSLKPFIYALAIDQGLIHPHTVLKDAPAQFGAYDPENFDRDFVGPVKAKDALTLSRNIPAIGLMNQLKDPDFYDFLVAAHVRGLKPKQHYGLSLALGGAEVTMQELVSLYAMLANQGIWRPLRMEAKQPQVAGEPLLSPEAAFLTLDILQNTPRPERLNAAMANQLPVYWKTGTSSGYRDAWSVGVFGPYVLAVWVGDFQGKSSPAYIGAKTAAPLFFQIIAAVRQQSPDLPGALPDPRTLKLTRINVCEASGMLPTRYCPNVKDTWFIPGKSPIKTDTVYREVAINSKTGLRTCHFDETTQWVVYEFWPSDILRIFAQAGVQRSTPPPFEPGCSVLESSTGTPPSIISPRAQLTYNLRVGKQGSRIPLSASVDADVKKIYWFADNHLIGVAAPNQELFWSAKAGRYRIRVVDDHGRTDSRELIVENVE
jgi:penicillin-binding protein 1C